MVKKVQLFVFSAFAILVFWCSCSITSQAEETEEVYSYYLVFTSEQLKEHGGKLYHQNSVDLVSNSEYFIIQNVKNNKICYFLFHDDDSYLAYSHDLLGSRVTKDENGNVVSSDSSVAINVVSRPISQFNNFSGNIWTDVHTNILMFDSMTSYQRYKDFGDLSGCLNDNGDFIYDDTMPGVKNFSLSFINFRDCHGDDSFFEGCVHFSWDLPSGWSNGDYYHVLISTQYNYATSWTTKRIYGSSFVDYSEACDRPIYISDRAADLCADSFVDVLGLTRNDGGFFTDYVQAFHLGGLEKIYIRSERVVNGVLYCGNWYVYSVSTDRSLSLNINHPVLGNGTVIRGDADILPDGNYAPGSEVLEEIEAPSTSDFSSLFGIDFTNPIGVISSFYVIVQTMISSLGVFPALLSSVFSFLPLEISYSILLVFYMAVVVGIIKIFT